VFKKPVRITNALKEHIAQEIIDKILERTEKGKSLSGAKFKKYSKSYINSTEFKKYGKNPNKVDLELKGDMAENLDLLSIIGNKH